MGFKFTAWGWYWIFWLFAGFLVPECWWIITGPPANTLSENFWALEYIDRAHPFDFAEWTPVHWIFGIFFLIFLLWLFFHLIFGFLA